MAAWELRADTSESKGYQEHGHRGLQQDNSDSLCSSTEVIIDVGREAGSTFIQRWTIWKLGGTECSYSI